MSLMEQDITKKERVDKNLTELKFDASNSKKYKVEVIWDSVVYTRKFKGHLTGLYYQVA